MSCQAVFFAIALALGAGSSADAAAVRVKDLGHFLGWRDNALVGYGIVVGLPGSGDSPRSELTRQALKNVLSRFGANVTPDQVQSRNAAAVIVTATLPPSSHIGDKIDVTISSVADARSLAGGTLLMTPLVGPDQRTYGLAQGPVVVGGYRVDSNQNREQKNFPASGVISAGATVETPVNAQLLSDANDLTFILSTPDVTTAQRICDQINTTIGDVAKVAGPSTVSIAMPLGRNVYDEISRIEDLTVDPDELARVVVNERAGTVVAGADVWISSVVVSQGDVRVSITSENTASQPVVLGNAAGSNPGIRSMVITNTKIAVADNKEDAVVRFPSTTVADLVEGLHREHVSTREIISVLQAVKAAGALHADLIVQ